MAYTRPLFERLELETDESSCCTRADGCWTPPPPPTCTVDNVTQWAEYGCGVQGVQDFALQCDLIPGVTGQMWNLVGGRWGSC